MKKSDNFIFENYETDNLINRRAAIITIAQGGLFSLLAGRLAYLQIANRDNYKILSDKNRILTKYSWEYIKNLISHNMCQIIFPEYIEDEIKIFKTTYNQSPVSLYCF